MSLKKILKVTGTCVPAAGDDVDTDRIIPALFSGRTIYEIRSTANGELQYRGQPRGPWITYDANATVFALARRNGWKTGCLLYTSDAADE